MKTETQPTAKHIQGELLQEGRTLYILHETGKFIKGQKELCNKFYLSVQPDYARGITDEDAKEYATRIVKCVNMHDELIEALKLASSNLVTGAIATRELLQNIIKQAEQK